MMTDFDHRAALEGFEVFPKPYSAAELIEKSERSAGYTWQKNPVRNPQPPISLDEHRRVSVVPR
jgi:hypothetical protein